jgi:hypothetical protein
VTGDQYLAMRRGDCGVLANFAPDKRRVGLDGAPRDVLLATEPGLVLIRDSSNCHRSRPSSSRTREQGEDRVVVRGLNRPNRTQVDPFARTVQALVPPYPARPLRSPR